MSRPIKAIPLPQLELQQLKPGVPEFRWVDPTDLLVEGDYQRDLGENSIGLIRRIAAGWDWSRFKPPVVAETPEGLFVIDGQHTAISAASRPEIGQIPVMVISAPEMKDRALSFVGHNRDRLALTVGAIHFANLAAGDETALTMQQVCARAGVTLLRIPPGRDFRIGDSMAFTAIRSLVSRRGAMISRIVLECAVKGMCGPVRAEQVKAIETLLYDPEFRGDFKPDDLTSAIMLLGDKARSEAQVFAAAHNVPIWRGLVVVLSKEARRGRRRAA